MENVRELLDAIKEKKQITSDNALAAELGLRRQRISDYYKGERTPDNFVCKQIAEILGKPLAAVIAAVEADTEKDEARREVWRDYFKSIARHAACICCLLASSVILFVTAPSDAVADQKVMTTANGEYKLCDFKIVFARLRSSSCHFDSVTPPQPEPSSLPRKCESRLFFHQYFALYAHSQPYWIPACAGMTKPG